MPDSGVDPTARALFGGLRYASARTLLARACTDPEGALPDESIQAAVADEAEARWLAETARRTALAGLLWSRLTPRQRELLPSSAREALADTHLGLTLRGEALRRLLERYVTRLDECGIPVLLLKGAALMQTIYMDPAERVMRDIDLLVPDEKLERARAIVGSDAIETRPDRPTLRHLGAMLLPGEYTSVELHSASYHVRWWPRLEPGDPFTGADRVRIGDTVACRLSPADNFLHIACHGVCHSFSDWPIMAGDLSRLVARARWDTDCWERICRAAQRGGRRRSILTAAAFASGGLLPPALRELLPVSLCDDAEARARSAWRLAFDEAQPEVSCWHRAWVRDRGAPQLGEIARQVLPSLPRVTRRFGSSSLVALALYPWYAVARAGKAVATGWRWRSSIRRYG